jgi:transposase
LWLAARRLHQGKFSWCALREGRAIALDEEQLQALVVGLPWQHAGGAATISVL